MENNYLFSGLKVVELASVLAGPATGQFFAELGADVIKVEHPGEGDVTRSWRSAGETGRLSAYFTSVNWGKRSIALSLRDPDDREILNRLLQQADMVITSFRPLSEYELKLDYQSVRSINQNIIYGQITGYGNENTRVGYDAIVQAESGFMYMNGQPGGVPQKLPVALIDLLAAHQLKQALLLAYIRKQRTGTGSYVSVSLLDAALTSLANQASNYLVGGNEPQPSGSLHPNIAPYGEMVITRDGDRVLFAVGNDRQFASLCRLRGLEAAEKDHRFQSNEQRVINRQVLFQMLQSVASGLTSTALLDFCHKNHIPAGRIRRVSEAVEDARHLWLEADSLRGMRTIAPQGIHTSGVLSAPPVLDEHRENILRDWLGQ